jgi:hypothetical protein
MPDIDDKIRFGVPIMLDDVSVRLGPWSGYHVLAQHPIGEQYFIEINVTRNEDTSPPLARYAEVILAILLSQIVPFFADDLHS